MDSAQSHAAFIQKYNLPFPLLLDPDRKIATAYGAANGIPILGLNRRITFVIDENGRIVKVYPQVDPAANAGQILKAYASTPRPTPSPAPTAAPTPNKHRAAPEDSGSE